MSTLAGQHQTLRQPIYHAIQIPAAGGATQQNFFQAASSSSLGILTNLTQDGRLPTPDEFELFSPRIVPSFTAIVLDVVKIVTSFSQVWVNNRDFLSAPSFLLPAGAGVVFMSDAIAAPQQTTAHGAPSPEAVFNMGKNFSLKIRAGQSFRHLVDWSTSPSALPANATYTWCVWDGLYTRAAQ